MGGKLLAPELNQPRLDLYNAGLNDTEIGQQLGLTKGTVARWRKTRGLAPNHQHGGAAVTPEQHAQRLALYETGLSDVKIAKRMGLGTNAIQYWRQKFNLPPHVLFSLVPFSREQRAERRRLHALGYSDSRIAREVGVRHSTVTKWRERRHLPAHYEQNPYRPDTTFQWPKTQDGQLMRRIVAAVGYGLTPDIAAEAVADLALAVVDGSVVDIEAAAPSFRRKAIGKWASRYGARSLDEELGDSDGFRMIDLIPDHHSKSWLEEMGATVS